MVFSGRVIQTTVRPWTLREFPNSPVGTSRALMYFRSPKTWSSHRFLQLKFLGGKKVVGEKSWGREFLGKRFLFSVGGVGE